MTYELHPLCTLFPRLTGAEFDTLRDDIKASGLRQAIVLHNGMILDGGNRYRACVEAGVEPRFVQFKGDNLVQFVLSVNLHRRHMTVGQQAAIVSSAQDWGKAQSVGKPKSANVGQLATVEQRAAQSGASRNTQKAADKVAKASPDLARKVAHGEVSLPKALAQVENKPAKVAPPVAPLPPADDDFGPSAEEVAASQQALDDELASLRRIADADDKLAEALAMLKQKDAMVQKLSFQINSLTNQLASMTKTAKYWQRKAEKVAA